MAGLFDELRVLLHGIWNRRWIALAVAWSAPSRDGRHGRFHPRLRSERDTRRPIPRHHHRLWRLAGRDLKTRRGQHEESNRHHSEADTRLAERRRRATRRRSGSP